MARGEFLAFLDDDDVFLPGHLHAALQVLGSGDADAACTNHMPDQPRAHRPGPARTRGRRVQRLPVRPLPAVGRQLHPRAQTPWR
ncbi:MAG: glycosyltransferase [Streptosporangiaceae bacterium]